MANYQLLKADIDKKVYQNGEQEITGANLNAVLNAMVTTLGAGYQFAGVATIDTNPGAPDAKVFYIANGKGTYTNFSGIEVTEDDVVVLYWDSSWHKVSTGIASQAKLSELKTKLNPFTQVSFIGETNPNFDTARKVFTIPKGTFVKWNYGEYELDADILLNWEDSYSIYYIIFRPSTKYIKREYRGYTLNNGEYLIGIIGASCNKYILFNSIYSIDDITFEEQLNDNHENIKELAELGYYKYTPLSWGPGSIDSTYGIVVPDDRYSVTSYIKVSEINGLIIDNPNGRRLYMYKYAEDKSYIKGYLDFSDTIKTIELDCQYVRIVILNEYVNDFTIRTKGIPFNSDGYINNADIVVLNKIQEPLIIQSTAKRASGMGDTIEPLTFIHFSDIHAKPTLWQRLVEYMNKYADYIQFAIHTGDYCGGTQSDYIDLYDSAKSQKPIYNCVGNHDTYIYNADHVPPTYKNPDKSVARNLLFNHTENWNVVWGAENVMYYFKDFNKEKIRLIVLDYYYDLDAQKTWLQSTLRDARALGYSVITATHEVTYPIVDKLNVTFQTKDSYEQFSGNVAKSEFDAIIKEFKTNGGSHIANLCGHEHADMVGYTENGTLNIAVECATNDNIWTDGKRVEGTRTYDCFNVISVNSQLNIIKIVRIGNNSDHYLRGKNILTYDYLNKKVIANY